MSDNCNQCHHSEFNGITTICCYDLPFPVGGSQIIEEKDYKYENCPKEDNDE